ncbi:MAG TPA: HoxN/HupN/NixA family nickel/cobalt transporter [Candidatus Cybelea sp.]|jgi:high-affinity nickel-transport protein
MVSPRRRNVMATYALLLGTNAAVWLLALSVFAPHPLLLGTALLAYAFGLRHAIDADHICAIDNVTRKLVQDGKRPIGVGLFFSLGHSTIVIVLTVAIVFAAGTVKQALPSLQGIGGVVGTSISAAFLFLIAVMNALALRDVVHALRSRRQGAACSETSLQASLDRRGLLGRCFAPLLSLVSRSRHMYVIGLLFGLGFDTATEVALLGIAAIEAGKGMPVWAILIFPALFAAGMSLLDTTDGILMTRVYGWAFVQPERKLYYNFAVTSASVVAAVLIGGIELAGLLGSV